jgi:hypothetical protein
MWPFSRRHRGKVRFVKVPVRVQGKYDAAQTTPENRNHWAAADGLESIGT